MSNYQYLKDLSNGATITIGNKKYHTIDDWGMVISNTVYVSAPEQVTNYVEVPGMNGFVDLSEALVNYPVYKKRELSFVLSKVYERKNWDALISDLRNKINGRIAKVTFDNDQAYYWTGRIYVSGFERAYKIGKVTISIPECEPYKYNLKTSSESWLWDPFNFRTGIITQSGAITVNGTATYKAPSGYMPVSPEFICTIQSGDTLKVSDGSHNIDLKNGTVYDPRIVVNGDSAVTLTFTGKGKVEVVYRGGSL